MNRKKIGFSKLVEVVGKKFFDQHEDSFVFSSQEMDKGLWCFLGVDLHPETREFTLSASIEEWDIYASCYVEDDGNIIMDECKLP